jgi:hypothetical protein
LEQRDRISVHKKKSATRDQRVSSSNATSYVAENDYL